MSFLERIERVCATFIERAFAKTFPSDLEPAQIARKLVSTMEAQTRGEEGQLGAPSRYTVFVSPEDFDRLAEHREYLERAWGELLRDLSARVGIALDGGDARVTLAERESIPLGAIAIELDDEQTATPERADFRLRMIKGVPPDALYPIRGKARIGRSDEGEIVLVDPSVSRTHAVLEVQRGRAVVRDLESTNGTFVNGRRVRTQTLRDGDELLFGNTKMRFEAS